MMWWWLGAALAGGLGDAADASVAEAWRASQAGEHATARRLAEARLAADPDDPLGHLVLGRALWQGEGDLEAARWHLEEAIDEAEDRDLTDEITWRTHAQSLLALADVLGALDLREAQLRVMDRHDAGYDPDLDVQRIWPLMKLGRYSEARGYVAAYAEDTNVWRRLVALNGSCAIEGEAGDRRASWDACSRSFDAHLQAGQDLAVPAFNLALSADFDLRLDQTERIARMGLSGSGEEVSNPNLVRLLVALREGRGAAAVEAAQDAYRWRLKVAPSLRDQNRTELEARLAALFLAFGETERGLAQIDRAITWPDRLGFTSELRDQVLGSHLLLRVALRQDARARAVEDAAASGWLGRAWAVVKGWLPDWADRSDRATLRALAARGERATGLFRVYSFDGFSQVPVWLHGAWIDVLGTGVSLASLEAARALDPDRADAAPFYDALEAEIRWRRGEAERARALVDAALAALPPTAVLVAARVRAVGFALAWAQGDREAAWQHLAAVLDRDPGVLRRLGLAIPVSVRHDGTTVAAAAADALAWSPRFEAASGAGLPAVEVRTEGEALRACLLGPYGEQLACARAAPPPAEGEQAAPDVVAALVEAVHDGFFALPARLDRTDLRSLDSVTTWTSEKAAARMRELLEGVPDQVER